MTQALHNNKMAARLYGIFFIFAFLSYGIGLSIIDGMLLGEADGLQLVDPNVSFTLSILSIVVIHTLMNSGVLVIMYRVLSPFSALLSLGYFVLGIMATLSLLIGGIALMLIVSAGESASELSKILYDANFYLYQSGMTLWGIGGILMCVVLLRTNLVPRLLPIWGLIGYVIFIVGTMSEFFKSDWGVIFSAPGGLFEVGLSIWLIARGFNPIKLPEARQAASSIA